MRRYNLGTVSSKRVALAIGGVAGILLGYVGFSFWKASRTLHEAGVRVAAENQIRFTTRRLDAPLPAGFETIASPAVYRDAVLYRGRLWLCGPAGLSEYEPDGALQARYRPGLELPGAPLTAVAVASTGDSGEPELWIATSGEGLVAFDGRQFRQVRPEEPRYRKLTAVLPLQTGRILVGTEKAGVLVWDGRKFSLFHPSLADVPITTLAGDGASLWAGTLDRGVIHWHAGRVDTFGEAEGLPDPQVTSLTVAGDAAYVGTAMGVAEFRGGGFQRVLAPGYFAVSLLARPDSLLVGTLDEGLVEVPLEARPGRVSRLSRRSLCEDCSVRRVLPVGGRLYTLTGDSLYDERHVLIDRERALLADRNISALAMDSAGRLWVGYFDRGLEILPAAGGRGKHVEDEHVFCVNRIVPDADRGVTAVATANGLVMFDAAGNERRVLGPADGLIANHVTDVALRPGGGFTVATPAGITILDGSGASSLYAFQGLVNNHAYALATAGSRTLIGTLGGLSILDGAAISASFTTANSGLKHNWITAIARVGDDWFVGTYGAGVLKLDNVGRWQTFPDLAGEVDINPNAMAATDRAVYAGTLGRGLAVCNRSSGRWDYTTIGLPSQNVTALTAHGGWLYIGTDNGLVRVPENNLVH